jgi:hypothetical protein
MATEEHRTKSELFRDMFRVYRSYRKRHPEPEIDDEWVMQVIREAQEEQRQSPVLGSGPTRGKSRVVDRLGVGRTPDRGGSQGNSKSSAMNPSSS